MPLPVTTSARQVLRKQREKDAELARVKAEREAEGALRALERKLQLQDKVGGGREQEEVGGGRAAAASQV